MSQSGALTHDFNCFHVDIITAAAATAIQEPTADDSLLTNVIAAATSSVGAFNFVTCIKACITTAEQCWRVRTAVDFWSVEEIDA